MDHHELTLAVRELRESADCYVRAYASVHTPHVPAIDLDAICRALGEISIDEAVVALDCLEAARS